MQWLDTSDIYHPDRQLQIKRLVDYATRHDGSINLPHGLLINGVRIEGAGAPIAGGSFADVFVGVYRDQSVAVKRFRAFPSDTDEKDKVYTVSRSIFAHHYSLFTSYISVSVEKHSLGDN
jgi:hypothetical protein